MNIQLARDIPALDTPAFSDWMRGVQQRDAPRHIRRGYCVVNVSAPSIRPALVAVAKGYTQPKPANRPKPKRARPTKPARHAPILPKRTPVTQVAPWTLAAPSREDVARAEKRGMELRDADPYEASVDTLPAPLRAVVTELDARIAREFGGGGVKEGRGGGWNSKTAIILT